MLGRFVRVKVTAPIFSTDTNGITYNLNFGEIDFVTSRKREKLKAFVLGINHPVKTFDGRIIASFDKNGETYYVVSPKSKKYIINDVKEALAFFDPKKIQCLYERSCGAIVYRKINGEYRYLVIKNNRSNHWSFPKGHVEQGETLEDTAKREVLEETGLHIEIIPGFMTASEYLIQNRVEKTVNIFVASTKDTNTTIQESEIEDYAWLAFDNSVKRLKFENDRKILLDAKTFLLENHYIQ